MIEMLQWLALAMCVFCAAWRLPAALRGRNPGLFGVFVLLVIAVGLSLPPIYLPVDAALGGRNLANLLVRFALYGIFFVLALKLAAAFRSPRAARVIRGPVGLTVLAVVCLATIVLFLLSDLPVSRAGLVGYLDQPSVRTYSLAGRLYPAFVAACMLVPAARTALTAPRPAERIAAGLIAASLGMVFLLTVLQLTMLPVGALIALLSYGSIVLLAAGLTVIWISVRRQRRFASTAHR
ncbi:MAG: hypothetical protein JWO93_954 [Micrococcaceae bacterium]|nr:hypothetical protein [Micrococcaceae bacterium]